MPLLIGAIVVALAVIGGVITVIVMNNGDEGQKNEATQTQSEVPGHRGPDLTKTIDPIKCTEPDESYNDPDKIQIPDFVFKNWKSVQACLQAKGWKYGTTEVNENTYGEGTVMKQYPAAGTDVDPNDMPKFQIDISTGNPA